MYEDDGRSFEYRQGAWMGIAMQWEDRARRLTLSLAPGSRMLRARAPALDVRVAGSRPPRTVTFTGARACR